jgi:hypothetical protein
MIAAVMCVVGAASLAGGIIAALSTRSFVERSRKANGAIVRLETVSSSEGGTSYRPVVSYKTAAGKNVEFGSRILADPAPYQPGDSVVVLYEPGQENRAEIQSFSGLWFGPTLAGSLGALFLAVGAGMLAGRPRAVFGQAVEA